jgi:hypothetical protein
LASWWRSLGEQQQQQQRNSSSSVGGSSSSRRQEDMHVLLHLCFDGFASLSQQRTVQTSCLLMVAAYWCKDLQSVQNKPAMV